MLRRGLMPQHAEKSCGARHTCTLRGGIAAVELQLCALWHGRSRESAVHSSARSRRAGLAAVAQHRSQGPRGQMVAVALTELAYGLNLDAALL